MHRRKKTSDARKRTPLRERILDALDIPLEETARLSAVELIGDRMAVVCGCLGVLSYDTERIVLRVVSGSVIICGASLQMRSLIGDRVTVCGRIRTVQPEGEEETAC